MSGLATIRPEPQFWSSYLDERMGLLAPTAVRMVNTSGLERDQSTRSCEARVELHTRREARFEMFQEPARCIRYHPSGVG